MQRGEVWWADHPAGQRHPVLLLSWDAHGNWRPLITVALVTTTIRYLDAEVPLSPDDGMPRLCVANLDAIATIQRTQLASLITALSAAKMGEVERAIHIALGIPVPCPNT